MVQDTSLSTEMYLSKHNDGSCGGWGLNDTEGGSSSSSGDVDYSNLRECHVLWATSVPAESEWCGEELDGHSSGMHHDSIAITITEMRHQVKRATQRYCRTRLPDLEHTSIPMQTPSTSVFRSRYISSDTRTHRRSPDLVVWHGWI